MTLVTLSAPYGAGGSRVGPAVAERLDLPFVDRAIPTGVAERLALPLREAVARDESVENWLTRALLSFGQVGPVLAGAAPPPTELVTGDAFRAATEQVLHELAAQGAVVLGRAGALVLARRARRAPRAADRPARRADRPGRRARAPRPRDRRAPPRGVRQRPRGVRAPLLPLRSGATRRTTTS